MSAHSKEKELLYDLCQKHGVNPDAVEELLKIEKEYQLRERRHGIYDRLRDSIKASIGGARSNET